MKSIGYVALGGLLLVIFSYPGTPMSASGFFNCDTLVAAVTMESDISCFGGNDGALSVDVSGGSGAYQFFWSTGDTISVVTGLSAGMYSVNVIDANQCFTIGYYNLQQPAETPVSLDLTPASCGNNDGMFEVSPTDDNGPYQFALNAGDFQASGNFENLPSGVYAIQVQNGNGCQSTELISLPVENAIALDTIGIEMASCFDLCDGQAAIEISEDGTFSTEWYELNEMGETMLVAEGQTLLDNICAGSYFALTEGESGGSGGVEEFWVEEFGSGCNQGQAANGFVSGNGTWSTTATGANAAQANVFYVSAAEQIGTGNCGTGCGGENNRTLHISNIEISIGGFVIVAADGGALYLADATTNIRAESPMIDCSNHTDVELSFDYIEFGQGDFDNASLWYFNGTDWSELDDLVKTSCCGGPCNGSNQGQFVSYSVDLPPSANNNPNVRIGFNWVNNSDGQGSDPSFAVDNISFSGNAADGSTYCPTYSTVIQVEEPDPIELFTVKFGNVTCVGGNDGAIEVQALGGTSPYSYTWDNDSTGTQISNLLPGDYTVIATDEEGCQVSETYTILDGVQDVWASFEISAIEGTQVTFLNNSSSGEYSWDFGDGTPELIDSLLSPVHVFPGPGVFNVCLTVEHYCGSDVFCEDILFTPTGLNDWKSEELIEVFPNPASSNVWFEIPDSDAYTISFFDVHSKKVESVSGKGSRFADVSGWPAGVYIWVVESDRSGGYRYGKLAVE